MAKKSDTATSPRNLVIVESPAKAKTIEGYLGSDYLVKSSYGHIRDLSKSDLCIDIENGYKPQYTVPDDKKALVEELRRLSSKADVVWLASDEDREGEAISWHIFDELNLPVEKTRRIVFHEITKPAILKAIETPRQISIWLMRNKLVVYWIVWLVTNYLLFYGKKLSHHFLQVVFNLLLLDCWLREKEKFKTLNPNLHSALLLY
jgi:reverse gyrase